MDSRNGARIQKFLELFSDARSAVAYVCRHNGIVPGAKACAAVEPALLEWARTSIVTPDIEPLLSHALRAVKTDPPPRLE